MRYLTVQVEGNQVFYREAGDPKKSTILLLHGFPTSSHMFRRLIPLLAKEYHVVAPDFLGFGFSDAPDRKRFKYTFENLAQIVDQFTVAIGLKNFMLYIFDYGAPIGLRIALKHPEKILAIVSQNGNAYEEGLSEGWNPIQKYWREPNEANRAALRPFLSPEAIRDQYWYGVKDKTQIAPEAFTLDAYCVSRPGNIDIQLDLFLDYASNVKLYPSFQDYLRKKQPPLLAVWGKNDPFFLPQGAEAYKKDIPSAKIQFYDTGHFALETHVEEIASTILPFLNQHLLSHAQ
jgi:pimeloyl-ACP methyl ester carboxylesterase